MDSEKSSHWVAVETSEPRAFSSLTQRASDGSYSSTASCNPSNQRVKRVANAVTSVVLDRADTARTTRDPQRQASCPSPSPSFQLEPHRFRCIPKPTGRETSETQRKTSTRRVIFVLRRNTELDFPAFPKPDANHVLRRFGVEHHQIRTYRLCGR